MRGQDAAFYAMAACAAGAAVSVRRPARALGFGAGALAAGALSRRWSRTHPAPFPHSQRWALHLARVVHPPAALLDALSPRPGERILEIGPGNGHHAVAVAPQLEPGGRLDVLDVQAEMLDEVMQRVGRLALANVTPTCADASELPYPDATFDAVYLVSVLGEIPRRDETLRHAARVLKPGGRLVVAEHFLDPDFVPLATLTREGAAAGLHLDRRVGSSRSYFACLVAVA